MEICFRVFYRVGWGWNQKQDRNGRWTKEWSFLEFPEVVEGSDLKCTWLSG